MMTIPNEASKQEFHISTDGIDENTRTKDMATEKEIEAQELLAERYENRELTKLTIPRRPVTRKDYVDFVRPWTKNYEMSPEIFRQIERMDYEK